MEVYKWLLPDRYTGRRRTEDKLIWGYTQQYRVNKQINSEAKDAFYSSFLIQFDMRMMAYKWDTRLPWKDISLKQYASLIGFGRVKNFSVTLFSDVHEYEDLASDYSALEAIARLQSLVGVLRLAKSLTTLQVKFLMMFCPEHLHTAISKRRFGTIQEVLGALTRPFQSLHGIKHPELSGSVYCHGAEISYSYLTDWPKFQEYQESWKQAMS